MPILLRPRFSWVGPRMMVKIIGYIAASFGIAATRVAVSAAFYVVSDAVRYKRCPSAIVITACSILLVMNGGCTLGDRLPDEIPVLVLQTKDAVIFGLPEKERSKATLLYEIIVSRDAGSTGAVDR